MAFKPQSAWGEMVGNSQIATFNCSMTLICCPFHRPSLEKILQFHSTKYLANTFREIAHI